MSIRQRRLDKGWSQSQLGEFSGLSLRTIQRIEKGHKPTMESLKSLAAVFETDVATLTQDNKIDESQLGQAQLEALQQIRELRRFFLHLFIYCVSAPLLVLADLVWEEQNIRSGLAALTWGMWLAYEAYRLFEASDLLGEGWEKRQLENRFGKKLK